MCVFYLSEKVISNEQHLTSIGSHIEMDSAKIVKRIKLTKPAASTLESMWIPPQTAADDDRLEAAVAALPLSIVIRLLEINDANIYDIARKILVQESLDTPYQISAGLDDEITRENDHISRRETPKQPTIHKVVQKEAKLAKTRPLLDRRSTSHSIESKNTELVLPTLQEEEFVGINIPVEACTDVYHSEFPELQHFTFDVRRARDEFENHEEQLRDFLQSHKNLRELQLNVPTNFDLNIIDQMQQLEVLHINGTSLKFSLNNPSAFQFDRLKKLTLIADEADISLLMHRIAASAAVDTLEFLRIECSPLRSFALDALHRFKNLREIQYKPCILEHTEEHVPPMRLQRLKRLALGIFDPRYFRLSPAMSSLQSLTLHSMKLDAELIATLVCVPHLKHLKLNCTDLQSYVTYEELNTLQNLNQLQILEMNVTCEMSRTYFTLQFLDNLGSTMTLRSLHLTNELIGNQNISCIERFHNLDCIEFVDCKFDFNDEIQLRQLQRVKELRFIGVTGNPCTVILNALGTVDTLEKLYIDRSAVDDNSIVAFHRFSKLRELHIDGAQKAPDFHLWKTVYLPVRILSIANENYVDIFKLACYSKTITFLLVSKCHGLSDLDESLFHKLKQSWRGRRVTIEIHDNSDLPAFLYHNDYSQYFEIQQVK